MFIIIYILSIDSIFENVAQHTIIDELTIPSELIDIK